MAKTAAPEIAPVQPNFRDRLREAIAEPTRRMLLRAADVWREHTRGTDPRKAVFETTSGIWHHEFITLWELFDERELFASCVERLAELARRVRAEKGYTTIVTSTATAKHLVEYVHARIESDEDRIAVRYLGPYPFLGAGNREIIDFNGDKVLIIADVIDSGKLVSNIAKAIRDLNGDPVAALCLATVSPDHARVIDAAGEFVLAIGPGPTDRLRVHTLTDYPIARVEPPPDHTPAAGEPGVKVIKLDPETLLPILPPPRQSSVRPAIGPEEMYDQFERSGAIAFDFFQTDAGLLTTAIRLRKLFKHSRTAVWAAVRDRVLPHTLGPEETDEFKPPLIVTTFDWGDVAFKEFVEDRLNEAGSAPKVIFAGRRDDGGYFILDHYRAELADQAVVLLLSSVQSGEKVRALAALLVSLGVRKIDVVCLLNRMGQRTAAFLTLARQLMRGLTGEPLDQVPFNFYPVYCLSELASEDIRTAQNTVRTLFDHYASETRVPSFRRWVVQVWAYFEAKSLTGHKFTEGDPVVVGDPIVLPNPNGVKADLTIRTEDGKLSVLCGHVAADRNYDPILDEIEKSFEQVRGTRNVTVRKHVLYKLYAVLLADVSYLRMVCRFSRLRRILHDQIGKCRSERFRVEDSHRPTPPPADQLRADGQWIDTVIELETHLLFGWAMFSYLDHNFDYGYGQLALDAVTCGKPNVADWDKYPDNFRRYFGEERVVWTVSLLLLLSHPRLRSTGRGVDASTRVVEYAKKLVLRVQRMIDPKDTENLSESVSGKLSHLLKIKSNLDMLLTELGVHELRQPVDVIRYLHSSLFKARRHHSPIVTGMTDAVAALREVSEPTGPTPDAAGRNQRYEVESSAHLTSLDDGIYIAGQLQTVAEAVHRLFSFHSATREEAGRFMASAAEKGFAADVGRFGDILQAIRKDKRFSITDLEDLEKLHLAVLTDLWDEHVSYLRRTLGRYVVPLEPAVIRAMETATAFFKAKRYAHVWKRQIEQFKAIPADKWHYVLVEPLFLREVLKNIFLNVRYNLRGVGSNFRKKNFPDLVGVAITASPPRQTGDPTADPVAVIRLQLVSKGRRFDPEQKAKKEDTTLDQHAHGVMRYGGELTIDLYGSKGKNDHDGTEVNLRLICRGEYRQFWTLHTGEGGTHGNAGAGMG